MATFDQSLPARQLHLKPATHPLDWRKVLGRWLALLAAGLVGCGKATPPEKPAAQAVATSLGQKEAGAVGGQDLLSAKAEEKDADEDGIAMTPLEEQAQRIMGLYPEKNAQELLNVPEVNPALVKVLKGLAADPKLQAYMNSSVDLAAKFKGLDGPPGSYQLKLDLTVYNDSRTQRMLAAVVSEEPGQVVEFLVEELGEAAFDFTFTGADQTSNGISLTPAPVPLQAPPAEPDN
jgi:hypothetical protein